MIARQPSDSESPSHLTRRVIAWQPAGEWHSKFSYPRPMIRQSPWLSRRRGRAGGHARAGHWHGHGVTAGRRPCPLAIPAGGPAHWQADSDCL